MDEGIDEPEIVIEERDILPSDAYSTFTRLHVVIPKNAPARLKRLLILHELIEAVTGSHLIALFWEFVTDPVQYVKWRARSGDPMAMFWFALFLAVPIVAVINNWVLSLLAALLYIFLTMLFIASKPVYDWAYVKTELVMKYGRY